MTYERYQDGARASNGSPSSREIQSDVVEIREEMSKTLNELSTRLAPKELISQAISTFSGSTFSGDGGLRLLRSLSGAIGRNPIPAVLIASGVGYLLYEEIQGRRGSRTGSVGTAPTDDSSSTRAGSIGSGELVGRAREGAHELGHRASSMASQALQATRQAAHKGQDLIHEQPLVVAGLGLALGAALAGTAPLSRPEQQLLGEPAQELIGELEQRANQIKDRVEQRVRAAGEAAKQTLLPNEEQQQREQS